MKLSNVGEKIGKSIDTAIEKSTEKLLETKDVVVEKTKEIAEKIDDSYITSRVKAKILSDPLLSVFNINVETTNGKVTLTGIVETHQSIHRSIEIANSVTGVESVETKIKIKNKE